MTKYVATINVPGYLPMDDDPPVFETAREAWQYLADERRRDEDASFDAGWSGIEPSAPYSDAYYELAASASLEWSETDAYRLGSVYAGTPGHSGGLPDLGLVYSVSEVEPCRYSTVYNGEQWCDTHDSAFPCPFGEGE